MSKNITFVNQIISLIATIAGLSVLLYGSYKDWKYREIDNWPWALLGITALAIIFISYFPEAFYINNMLAIIAVSCSFFGPVFEWEEHIKLPDYAYYLLDYGMYAIGGVIFLLIYILSNVDFIFISMLIVFVMFIFIRILFEFNILHGGADAKALWGISFLFFDNNIHFYIFPLVKANFIFPFSFQVLFNALFISLFLPVYLALKNIIKKEYKMPQIFLGYKMPLEDIKKKFVWLMEFPDNRFVYFPSKTDDEEVKNAIEHFSQINQKEVWVTPQLPFVIFILGGFIAQVFLASVLYLIFFIL